MLPIRMVNEYVYCPRLFALEHLDGEWADSSDTVQGQRVHKRVDREDSREMPDARPDVRRSVDLGSEKLGIIAKIDLVEFDGIEAVPIDYKKGKVPPKGPYDPERVQICLQAMLLREHGYDVKVGILYFAGSKRRVEVAIDGELEALARRAIREAQGLVDAPRLPDPLQESPKCVRCSLVGICLPDEHHRLKSPETPVRPIAPMRMDAVPLHVEKRGVKLALRGGEITVLVQGKVEERVRLRDTSAVVVRGAASVTTPLMIALAEAGIPLSLHKWGGRHIADLNGISGHHVIGRGAQHRVLQDAERCLEISRSIVRGKIHNQRILVRRNAAGDTTDVLRQLKALRDEAKSVKTMSELLGMEGAAARVYFSVFNRMLRPPEMRETFVMQGRNRRPPLDPINAMLSFGYSMLARECTTVLRRVGLDPSFGVFHQLRPGRAALALDLMEEFRPIVADSVVLRGVNTGEIQAKDFVIRSIGVSLTDSGRRKFIRVFEERMSEEIQHPLFGYKMAYRRILEVQARLMSKTFTGEIEDYRPFQVR